jgi:hypothetical protein
MKKPRKPPNLFITNILNFGIMKNVFFILLLIGAFFSAQLSAQNNSIADLKTKPYKDPHLYLGFGLSGPQGGVLAFTFFTPSGWGGSVTYNILSPVSKNVPSDFAFGSGLFNLFGSSKIRDDIYTTSFRVIKEFPSTNTRQIRFGLEAGPSIVKTSFPDHFVPNPTPCDIFGCPSNYIYERVEEQTVGLSLKAKLEFPLAVPFGFEMGLSSNINRNRTFVAYEFLVNLGYLRERKKN